MPYSADFLFLYIGGCLDCSKIIQHCFYSCRHNKFRYLFDVIFVILNTIQKKIIFFRGNFFIFRNRNKGEISSFFLFFNFHYSTFLIAVKYLFDGVYHEMYIYVSYSVCNIVIKFKIIFGFILSVNNLKREIKMGCCHGMGYKPFMFSIDYL